MRTTPFRFKFRRGTTAQWAAANPVLLEAEPGLDTTLRTVKYGDGVTAWLDLPYSTVGAEGIQDVVGAMVAAAGGTYDDEAGTITLPSGAAVDPGDVAQAVADYLAANPPSGAVDATTGTKGVVRLAGDLGGTAASPTVPGKADKAALDGMAYSLSLAGLDDDTTDITPLISAAIAAGHRHILIPYRAAAWPMTTRLDASDAWIEFEPGARISCNLNLRAMDLTRVRLTNAHFTSPYTGPTSAADNNASGPYGSLEAREVRLGDGCVVDGYYHENASHGLNITAGSHITIQNAEFKNIRHMAGWGAAIHIAGVSSHNIRIRGIRIEDADRGIEIEAGARDVWAQGGHLKNVYPVPYDGQPAGFATYSFVLDAHSHEGESACININYRDFLLENCGGGVTFIRSNGTNAADFPRSCTAENIRVLGRAMSTGYETIAVQGYNNVVRGVHLMEGAGITSLMRIRMWGGSSENNRVEDVRAEAYALPLVTVDDAAAGSILANIRPTSPISGTGFLFDVAGRYTSIEQCSAWGVSGTSGYVRFQASADYSRLVGFNYSVATAETFPSVIRIEGAEHVRIGTTQGSNYATAPPVDIDVSGAARFASITGNNFDRASAGSVITLGASATRNLVAENVITSAVPVFTITGAENTVQNNKRGNWVDSSKGTATIADGQSSVTFNHLVSGAPEVVTVSPRVGELIWVSAITGTQATVSRTGTSGAHTFDWRADNHPSF